MNKNTKPCIFNLPWVPGKVQVPLQKIPSNNCVKRKGKKKKKWGVRSGSDKIPVWGWSSSPSLVCRTYEGWAIVADCQAGSQPLPATSWQLHSKTTSTICKPKHPQEAQRLKRLKWRTRELHGIFLLLRVLLGFQEPLLLFLTKTQSWPAPSGFPSSF